MCYAVHRWFCMCFLEHFIVVDCVCCILLYVLVFLLKNGRTALMMASEAGHKATVELLLEYGAQLDLKDHVRKPSKSLD